MSKFKRNNWGIIGNITGKFVKNKKGVQEFVPNFTHKYLPIPQIMRMRPDKSKGEIMLEEGLIVPPLVKDSSVFKKNRKEKSLVKSLKKLHNRTLRESGFDPKKRLNLSSPSVMKAQ